jgi:hypothetical protein
MIVKFICCKDRETGLNCLKKPVHRFEQVFYFLIFFFLDEKETKNQDNSPTSILFSHKKAYAIPPKKL